MANAQIREVLVAARERIDTPEKWWQQDGHNAHVEAEGDGGPTCAGNAISFAARKRHVDHFEVGGFFVRVNGIGDSLTDTFDWNDAPERRHDEILAAFDRAIEAA